MEFWKTSDDADTLCEITKTKPLFYFFSKHFKFLNAWK